MTCMYLALNDSDVPVLRLDYEVIAHNLENILEGGQSNIKRDVAE